MKATPLTCSVWSRGIDVRKQSGSCFWSGFNDFFCFKHKWSWDTIGDRLLSKIYYLYVKKYTLMKKNCITIFIAWLNLLISLQEYVSPIFQPQKLNVLFNGLVSWINANERHTGNYALLLFYNEHSTIINI